ncbi:unnamed protein product [Laminaria digitata]
MNYAGCKRKFDVQVYDTPGCTYMPSLLARTRSPYVHYIHAAIAGGVSRREVRMYGPISCLTAKKVHTSQHQPLLPLLKVSYYLVLRIRSSSTVNASSRTTTGT